MMDVPCAACLKLPTGIEGHDDLRVHGMGDARMSFECRSCGSLWSRLPKAGTTAFQWFGLNDLPRPRMALGIPVPPRSSGGSDKSGR